MSSAARPVNQPDALRLLLDRVLRGGDATLVAEGDAARVLLDLAADCLSGQRIRIVWAEDALPSRPTVAPPLAPVAAGRGPGVPDDVLSRSFQALTTLDPACDRIVLLVGEAHALQPSALRYIQFASRSAAHLQFVFCGTRAFFGRLNAEEFTQLRTRLAAGLVLTLAAPIVEEDEEDAPPVPASVPDRPAARAGTVATPLSAACGPAVSAGRRSWPLWLGALVLLGLGGMGGFMLASGAGGPAARQQAASVAQLPALADAPAPGVPPTGGAPRADQGPAPAAADAPPQPAVAGEAQGAASGPRPGVPAAPPSAKAPGALVTVWSPPRTAAPDAEPRPAPPPRSLGRSAPAAPSRAATAALDNRLRRLREARDEPALPRGDQWTPPEPTFGSWTAPVSPPTRYIGSYAADANGVRMFRPEP